MNRLQHRRLFAGDGRAVFTGEWMTCGLDIQEACWRQDEGSGYAGNLKAVRVGRLWAGNLVGDAKEVEVGEGVAGIADELPVDEICGFHDGQAGAHVHGGAAGVPCVADADNGGVGDIGADNGICSVLCLCGGGCQEAGER